MMSSSTENNNNKKEKVRMHVNFRINLKNIPKEVIHEFDPAKCTDEKGRSAFYNALVKAADDFYGRRVASYTTELVTEVVE